MRNTSWSKIAVISGAIVLGAQTAPASAADWTGFYIGGHLGGTWADFDYSHNQPLVPLVEPLSFDMSSFAGGGQGGYRHQFGNFVAGFELSYTITDMDDTVTSALVADRSRTVMIDDIFMATVNLGVPWNDWLGYITGGYAGADVDISSNVISSGVLTSSSSDWENGWTIGAGLEFAVTPNLRIGAQYNYVDLIIDDRFGVQTGGFTLQNHQSIDSEIHQVMARVSWQF
ncbi:MAG: outer membrane beta-barrel protein [Hyphomicrobiales bacterium]|nr:outer membrane beta-barrel protein [Hyphomicrobiales bacterium]